MPINETLYAAMVMLLLALACLILIALVAVAAVCLGMLLTGMVQGLRRPIKPPPPTNMADWRERGH